MAPRSRAGVSVVGNLNIDLILRGLGSLPAWGQEVEGTSHASVVAGQAGCLGLALAHVGVPVDVIGGVGADGPGREIVAALSRAGVGTEGVEVLDGEHTGLSIALVREDGERAFVSDFAASSRVDADLVRRHWTGIAQSRLLCLVGLFSLPSFDPPDARTLLAEARVAGLQTVLDTGWDPKQWPAATIEATLELLGEVDVFLPNLDEAEVLTGLRDPVLAAAALAAKGPSTVVVKCGAAGSYGLHGGVGCRVPSFPAEVYDAVGAGDSFNAGLLAGLVAGMELRNAMVQGNALASLYIARAVDRFPSAAEVAGQAARHPCATASDPEPDQRPS
jgi:sugar/nucleoside kinase (ribokinase family)